MEELKKFVIQILISYFVSQYNIRQYIAFNMAMYNILTLISVILIIGYRFVNERLEVSSIGGDCV